MFNNCIFFNEKAFIGDEAQRKAKLTRIFLHEALGHGLRIIGHSKNIYNL